MELIRCLSVVATLFALGAAFQINAHEHEREHLHCSDPGVNCTMQEDVVRGYRLVTPNSSPTTYTGGNAPTNSSSDNCEGSGCINYEESYQQAGPDTPCPAGQQRGQIVYGNGPWVCLDFTPPQCPDWLEMALGIGGSIGGISHIPVGEEQKSTVARILRAAPRYARLLRLASGPVLMLDLTALAYCTYIG